MPTTDTPSDQLAALVLVEGDEGHEERLDLRDVHGRVLREDAEQLLLRGVRVPRRAEVGAPDVPGVPAGRLEAEVPAEDADLRPIKRRRHAPRKKS